MTDDEVIEFVDRVHATYGFRPETPKERATIYSAWAKFTDDLEAVACHRALDEHMVTSKFSPKPQDIRKAVIINTTGNDFPPLLLEAWGQLQQYAGDLNHGVTGTLPHPVVMQAIKRLGKGALNLTTNGDREAFGEVYSAEVAEWKKRRFLP